MRQTLVIAVALAGAVAGAQTPPPAPRPPDTPFRDESLRYSINWPSGLSLGEAQMQASGTGERWSFAFSLDAAVPGFAVSDSYQAVAAGDFCSVELLKEATHGRRKTSERTKFEAQEGRATRESTGGGGKSELSVPACSRDGLTFFYYLRRELSQGRLPGPQTVYFGAPYQVRLEYGGPQAIRVNDRPMDAERVTVSYKGPASQGAFELYLSRDAARTPVMVRVPLAVGAFSMELVR
ncbi:MAG: DUF3108 domain-containing protein [Bryobacteraceae bacterium]